MKKNYCTDSFGVCDCGAGGIYALTVYKSHRSFVLLKSKDTKIIIKKLKDIREAQIAFKDAHGSYASNFDTLISFV